MPGNLGIFFYFHQISPVNESWDLSLWLRLRALETGWSVVATPMPLDSEGLLLHWLSYLLELQVATEFVEVLQCS